MHIEQLITGAVLAATPTLAVYWAAGCAAANRKRSLAARANRCVL